MQEEKIREIALNALMDTPQLFLVDVKIKGNQSNQKVLIFVDGDQGISIDQCAKINRKIGATMEEMDMMEGMYMLEVSSPGLDFPLTVHRQYQKNVGRDLNIQTVDEETLEGKLKFVDNDSITIELGNEDRVLLLNRIKQSKVIVSFK